MVSIISRQVVIAVKDGGAPTTTITLRAQLPNGQAADYVVTQADLTITDADMANFGQFLGSAFAQAEAKFVADFAVQAS